MLKTKVNEKTLASRIGQQKHDIRKLFDGEKKEDEIRIKALFNYLEGEEHRQRIDKLRASGL
jgi:hypothetical protein